MKSFPLATAIAAGLLATTAMAQTNTPTAGSKSTGTTAAPTASAPKDSSAATGNSNQAVTTTDANAAVPAKGSNSFTSGEAQSRLEKNGFSNVSGLTKDDDGIWRGKAQKNGQPTDVWLDYKGNAGTGMTAPSK